LQKDNEALKAAGINQVAISYDSIEVLKRFADKNEISYPMLSDTDSKLIDALGIRNKAMDGKKYGKNDLTGVPHPGTYVLDKDGVILGKLFLKAYSKRHDNEELITLLGEVVK
jgi:peroxiredoxin